MPRKTLKQRRSRDLAKIKAAKEADFGLDDQETIGKRILERSKTTSGTDADWFANELYGELLPIAEQRFPEVGELCFFSYSAAFGDKYPWWDRRPLAYILDIKLDSILAANLHYYNPAIRSSIAGSLINKREANLPDKTLHRYFITNIDGLFIIPEDSTEWADIAMLVTERFVNKYGSVSPETVWDSP